MTVVPKKILFISNGHGEDNHTSYVIRTLKEHEPNLDMAAMPIVGQGYAYRNLNIPIIGPTEIMPSGGFFYMNRFQFIKDIQAGLIGLTWRQLQAVLSYAPQCDLIMTTGDGVSQSFAYLTGRPFVAFISCLSSLYEGRLNLGPLLWHYFNSPRCLGVFTRDRHTAEEMGTKIALQALRGAADLDGRRESGRVHDLDVRCEQQMASRAGQQLAIPRLLPGIGAEIFACGELGRVDEDAGDHPVGPVNGLAHQRQMALVQRAHGRNKADRETFPTPAGDRFTQGRHGPGNRNAFGIGHDERINPSP